MVRQCFVLNDDFSDFVGHAFASPEIKRHPRPSPVIDIGFDRNKSFSVTALGLTPLFLGVTRHGLTVDDALTVLSTNYMILDARGFNRPQCFDNLDLLVADTLCLKRIRRFHRHQTQELHEMVLHHVTQLTHAVVISPTALNAHLFRNRDLNVINATLIPLGIDKPIGKSQHQEVLDRLFAKVVIDSVDILLFEESRQCFIDLTRGIKALTNWFFKDDAAWARQTSIYT